MVNENKKKLSTDNERKQTFMLFEELCWLLDANKDLNFKNASKYFKEYLMFINNKMKNDEHTLIGILPSLLKDDELFQSNSQLVQFAEEVLQMQIPRWEKKSRNEIIGLIVCEVEDTNKERINILYDWSKNILINKNAVTELQNKAKNTGSLFSWNEAIQRLTRIDNE